MEKKLTKKLIETEGRKLIGEKLRDFSSLKLENVKIIDVDVNKYFVKVKSLQGEYIIYFPYTVLFSL